MGHHSKSTTSWSPRSVVPDAAIKGSAFMGEDGCEHQAFNQPVAIIHGSGPDEGTVVIRIGDCSVSFDSTEGLIAGLQREPSAPALHKIAVTRAVILAGLAASMAGLMAHWVPMFHSGLGVFSAG